MPLTLEQLDQFGSLDDLPFTLDLDWYEDRVSGNWTLEAIDGIGSIDSLNLSLDDPNWGNLTVYFNNPASVDSSATVSASAVAIKLAAGDISSNASVSASATKLVTAVGVISSQADVEADAQKIFTASADITGSADVVASCIRLRESIVYPANYLAFGNAQISTAQYQFGSSSLALDGSGDYVRSPTNLEAFENSDYTVELWVRPNSSSSSSYIFDHRQNGGVSLRTSGTSLWVGVSGFIAVNIANAFPTPQIWYHIAITRSGNNTKCYINGVQKGSTYTTAYTASAANLFIGTQFSTLSNFLNGYVDEFRISNVVRYTTTFTPPASAFTYDSNTLVLLQFEGANGSTVIANSLPASTPSISANATVTADSIRTRVINTPQEITASAEVQASGVRIKTGAGAITADASVSCLGSFEFSGFADIFCEASVTANAGQTLNAVAYINVNGQLQAIGYIYGEEWSGVTDEVNAWSDVAVGSNIWIDASGDSKTWSEVVPESALWQTQQSGTNTWLQRG